MNNATTNAKTNNLQEIMSFKYSLLILIFQSKIYRKWDFQAILGEILKAVNSI